MTLEELGTVFRTAREQRGMDLAAVAQRLKINQRMLSALEAGERAALPDDVYLRGFIRSYGGYLGIPAETLAAALESTSPRSVPAMQRKIPVGTGRPMSFPWARTLGGVAILACLAGFAAYWFSHTSGEGIFPIAEDNKAAQLAQPAPLPSEETSREEAAAPAAPLSPAAALETPAASRDLPQDTSRQGGAGKGVASMETSPARAQGSTDAWTGTRQPAGDETAAPTPLPEGQHELVIVATGHSFLSIRLDGEPKRRVSLQAGDTLQLPFKDVLRIWARDADNLRLRYDGQDIPTPAGGRERVMRFPQDSQR